MDNSRQKILLICNESNSTYNFRKELILFLLNNNYEVYVTSRDSDRKDDIEKLGCKFFETSFNNRSRSIFSLNNFKKALKKVMKDVKPDVAFSFMLKPSIVAPKIAKKYGVRKIYAMLEGLGDAFQSQTFVKRFIRFGVSLLLRKAFKFTQKIFVLNNDDKNELVSRNIASENKITVIPGIGIDCNQFEPTFINPKDKKVVMFARLIKNKGILDYCELAKLVYEKRNDIKFELYGQEEEITKEDLLPYTSKGYLSYYGYTKDNKGVMLSSSIVVSTSFYREGMPRVILEAMALGKPVVATNTVGSKDLVLNGKTGFLFNMHKPGECADIILNIIDKDDYLIDLGKEARKVCEAKYDSKMVNKMILDVINA